MSPRITIHSSASGMPWHDSPKPSAPKDKSTVNDSKSPSHVSERPAHDVACDSDGTDELDSFSSANGALPRSTEDPGNLQSQWETISTVTTSSKTVVKKPRQKPPTTRSPGHSLIPLSRVESILRADPDSGSPSKEAEFVITLATEEFIRRLAHAAHTRSKVDNRVLTTYHDVSDTAFYFEEFNFLKDTIPRPMTLKQALAERQLMLEQRDASFSGSQLEDEGRHLSASKAAVQKLSSPTSQKHGKARYISANGKSTKKAKKEPHDVKADDFAEKQRAKRARVVPHNEDSVDASNAELRPSSRSSEHNVNAVPHSGSNASTSSNSGMKIKIKPRATTSEWQTPSEVTSLSPPPSMISNGIQIMSDEQDSRNVRDQTGNAYEQDYSLNNSSPGAQMRNDSLGMSNMSNVQFAPPHIDAVDTPLWTRVPLPPPPSPKTRNMSENRTSLEYGPDPNVGSQNAVYYWTMKDQAPKPRQRSVHLRAPQPQALASQSEVDHVDYREALSPSAPNPGRTIYSQ